MSLTSANLLARMVDAYAYDYRASFREYFDLACAQRKHGLAEPESEIFNAFNHFAWVAEGIKKLDDSQTELEALDLISRDAERNLELGRRHIWRGRIYCVEHLIEEISGRIVRFVDAATDAEHETISEWRALVAELDEKYNAQKKIESDESTDIEVVRASINYLRNRVLISMTDLLTEYATLYFELDDKHSLPDLIKAGSI